MAQMDLSVKQKQTHRHREQTCGCQGGGGEREREREFGLVDANHEIQNEKQQGPTVWYRELYSISCDKPQ